MIFLKHFIRVSQSAPTRAGVESDSGVAMIRVFGLHESVIHRHHVTVQTFKAIALSLAVASAVLQDDFGFNMQRQDTSEASKPLGVPDMPCRDTPYPAEVVNIPLTVLDAEDSRKNGAACLDGGPPGIYYRPASSTVDSKKWIIFFKGGGLCRTAAECVQASRGSYGTSAKFPRLFGEEGILDPRPEHNPVFAGWHHVVMWYCDGGSHRTNRTEPLVVPDVQDSKRTVALHFRGEATTHFILKVLRSSYGMRHAEAVLVSGASAGGESVIHHADYVRSLFPRDTKVRALSISGFWAPARRFSATDDFALGASTLVDPSRYNEQLSVRGLFDTPEMAIIKNSASVADPRCVTGNRLRPDEAWLCNSAYTGPLGLNFLDTPTFIATSSIDSCEIGTLLSEQTRHPSMSPSLRNGCLDRSGQLESCGPDEVRHIARHQADRLHLLLNSGVMQRVGFGGFVHSCLQHGGLRHRAGFWGYRAGLGSDSGNGGISFADALAHWWLDDPKLPGFAERASNGTHWNLPCAIGAAPAEESGEGALYEGGVQPPYQCSPSCKHAPSRTWGAV